MFTATVRYKLPAHIDYAAWREHFHKIAPGFQHVKGLLSKHFIWSESGWAGGVYQWETRDDPQAFYGGARLIRNPKTLCLSPPIRTPVKFLPTCYPSPPPALRPSPTPTP